jgi:hypothetical protein
MTQNFKYGVLTVTTLDRLEDLRRMVTSLWAHNKLQVQVMLAQDWLGAHELKSRMGSLTSFDNTVFLDTDIYINGDITPLLKIAKSGKLGIYRHRDGGHWNSGVMVFNKELGIRLSEAWAPHRKAVASQTTAPKDVKSYYRTDQKSLNEIISNYPIHSLSAVWNYIIPERTLEDEVMDWGKVKIFHFLHKRCFHRVASRSYKEWKAL